mmetsp:Transcript_3052/g.4806  ORF Transcript_3052/g.4806 Transcript_3052/m.4806 type:complete len:118 (-) Transcript_3052:278-631(-)
MTANIRLSLLDSKINNLISNCAAFAIRQFCPCVVPIRGTDKCKKWHHDCHPCHQPLDEEQHHLSTKYWNRKVMCSIKNSWPEFQIGGAPNSGAPCSMHWCAVASRAVFWSLPITADT